MPHLDKVPRLSRLTAILLKLQSRPFVAVEELAETFQVSKRTIYRDLLALEEAGVPIATEEGKGFSLVDGYHIPPVMFTESEAHALMMAEQIIAKSRDQSLISEFNRATDKIKAVLKGSAKQKAHFLAERTIIGINWKKDRNSDYLSPIQQALTNFHLLKIDYQKEGAVHLTSRKVEPFAIYLNPAENWILIAWCRLREEFRNFRLDRIQQLQVLEETFSPHEISLEEYVETQRIKAQQNLLR